MEIQLKRPHRWWRILLCALVTVVVGGITSLFVLKAIAHRTLEHKIAAIQQRGEPILPTDFEISNALAPDNAGPMIDQAADRIVKAEQDSDVWKKCNSSGFAPAFPLRPDEVATLQEVVTENAAILDIIAKAVVKPRAEWKLNLVSPILLHPDNRWKGLRGLCNLLNYSAMFAHEHGDDTLALQRVDEMIFVSRYADKYPSLVGHMLGIGFCGQASWQATDLTPDLRVGTGTGEASPADVRGLIDLLLDDIPPRDGHVRGFQGERMGELDTMQCMIDGTFNAAASGAPKTSASFPVFSKYELYRNASAELDILSNFFIPAGKASNWPTAKGMLPHYSNQDRISLGKLYLLSLPAWERALESYYRANTIRHLAAVALAMRWYAAEHNDEFPERIDALVPKYLPFVPVDPMTANNLSLRYNSAGKSPIVYSVGEDGIDDGGSETWITKTKFGNPDRKPGEWETKDFVVHLTRQPR